MSAAALLSTPPTVFGGSFTCICILGSRSTVRHAWVIYVSRFHFPWPPKTSKCVSKIKASKSKILCISCHAEDALDAATKHNRFPELGSVGQAVWFSWTSLRKASGEKDVREKEGGCPHACQYSHQRQFSRESQGDEGASLWQHPDSKIQDFKSGEVFHWQSGRPPSAVIYISLRLLNRVKRTHT